MSNNIENGLRIDLNILSDHIFTSSEILTIYGATSSRSREEIYKLIKIQEQYKLTHKYNFNMNDSEKLHNMIQDLRSYIKSAYEYYWYDVRPHYNVLKFIEEIDYRLKEHRKDRVLSLRSFKRVLGNFEESISPKMIHQILTWLKKKTPEKFLFIKRGIKEKIIHDIKSKGVQFDAKFLCKFIDENNPMEYVKEWNVKPYNNGKRMKNVEIRKLLKESFYEREVNSIRFKIISPNLGCLPIHVEDNITSYLGFNI